MNNQILYHAIHCECCSSQIDLLNDIIAYSDKAIAKALMVSEIAQIAKVESRMRQYLLNKWRLRVNTVSKRVNFLYVNGSSLEKIFTYIDKVMNRWDEEVAKRIGSDIEEIYRLARKAGWKKANGQTSSSLQYSVPNFTDKIESGNVKIKKARLAQTEPSFDLYDEQAIAQLQDDQMVWIGEHYDKNVRDTVRTAVKPNVIEGLGRVEAGKRLSRIIEKQLKKVVVPGGFSGSDAKYFEGLAANTATNSRVRGQVRSFVDVGVTRLEIVNPMDNRTSQICQYMNGKVFTIPQAVSQIEKVSGATTPDQVKQFHPWLSAKKVKEIGAGGTKDLAKQGIVLPPYHFRCRTTVDISDESVSFGKLSTSEITSIPDRKQPTTRNTPRRKTPTTKPPKKKASKLPAVIPKTRDILKPE